MIKCSISSYSQHEWQTSWRSRTDYTETKFARVSFEQKENKSTSGRYFSLRLTVRTDIKPMVTFSNLRHIVRLNFCKRLAIADFSLQLYLHVLRNQHMTFTFYSVCFKLFILHKGQMFKLLTWLVYLIHDNIKDGTFQFSKNVNMIDSISSFSKSITSPCTATSGKDRPMRSGATQALAAILHSEYFIPPFLGYQCTLFYRIFSPFVVASIQTRVLSLEARDCRVPKTVYETSN